MHTDFSPIILDGKKVKIHYTLQVEGEVVDTSEGKDPLLYLQGTDALVPGLQKGLLYRHEGENCRIMVPPEEAYGLIDESRITEVSKSSLPEGRLEIGYVVTAEDNDGARMHARVREIRDDTVLLDFNHPFAGKVLQFDVKVLEVI